MTRAKEKNMEDSCRYFVSENKPTTNLKLNTMKAIITILIAALMSLATAVNAQQQATKPAVPQKSIMVYSEEDEAIVYKSGSHLNGKEILIESLPGFGNDPIPVEVNPSENGSYTFKKHPSLVLPEYYTVIITDSLTGKQFDLKNSDSYTFDVSKSMPERFVLEMRKMKTDLTAMR